MTQNEQIKKHLRSGKSINALQALKLFGSFRLASRISELRDQGMQISSELVYTSNGKRISKYTAR